MMLRSCLVRCGTRVARSIVTGGGSGPDGAQETFTAPLAPCRPAERFGRTTVERPLAEAHAGTGSDRGPCGRMLPTPMGESKSASHKLFRKAPVAAGPSSNMRATQPTYFSVRCSTIPSSAFGRPLRLLFSVPCFPCPRICGDRSLVDTSDSASPSNPQTTAQPTLHRRPRERGAHGVSQRWGSSVSDSGRAIPRSRRWTRRRLRSQAGPRTGSRFLARVVRPHPASEATRPPGVDVDLRALVSPRRHCLR